MTIPARNSVILIVMFICANQMTAASYYFSTSSGDDSRSFAQAQNSSTPWKSISKFNAIFNSLQPGDVVYFRRGEVFEGRMVLGNSGSTGSPIKVSAYGNGTKPVIRAFDVVSQWTNIGGGIYESNALSTGSTVKIVTVNGINYPMGRFPNTNATNGGYLNISSTGSNSITGQGLSGNPDWDGAEVVIRTSHWTLEKRDVSSHSGASLFYSGSTTYSPEVNYGFFIQDHILTLDQYGEWYYNPATKKIAVYFGGAPGSVSVKVAAFDEVAEISGDHLEIEQLIFEGANRRGITNNSQNLTNLTIKNCDIQFSGIDGVFFQGATNLLIEDCLIQHSNNCGVKLYSCPDATIRSNNIENSGMQAGMGEGGDGNYIGLYSDFHGFVSEFNHIINSGYIGLRFGSGDNLLKNNFINTFCAVLDDGAGIYTYSSSGNKANRRVEGNIVINGLGAMLGTPSNIEGAAEGIYFDDNSGDIQANNNTIAWCARTGMFLHNVQDVELNGNTFFDNPVQAEFKSDHFGSSLSGLSASDNVYFSRTVGQSVFRIISDANDISSMGAFDHNYYVRPLNNQVPINTEYPNSQGLVVNSLLELDRWRSDFGHGDNSAKSPLQIPYYVLNDLLSANKLTNEGFDIDIVGTWCFSAFGDCNTAWVNSQILDGGAMEVSGPSPSRIGMYCGSVENAKNYIVRFSAYASEPASVEIFLMQDQHPWSVISSSVTVPLETNRREYEVMIQNPETEAAGTIQLQFGNDNTSYWLDNLQMYEANVTEVDPDDYIIFDYNASASSKAISFAGDYRDARNNAYSGGAVLQPYESIVLIKDVCSAGSICPSGDCTVNGNPIPADSYFASQRITSTGQINSGGNVEFLAGNSIELNPGFTINGGAVFSAMIANCIQNP